VDACVNHPDVPTSRHCEICGEPFCHACLEAFPSVGLVCASCEVSLRRVEPDRLEARLPALRREIRAQLPPPKRWWGWEVIFVFIVLLPSAVVAWSLAEAEHAREVVAKWTEGPLLRAQSVERLHALGAALETYHMAHQAYPESLDLLPLVRQTPETAIDPFSVRDEAFLYAVDSQGFRLCSRGDDHIFRDAPGIDRFTGVGDLCIGDGPPIE